MTEEGLHPSALGPLPGEITAASSIQHATGLAFPKRLLLLATDVRTQGSGDPLSRRPENSSQRGTHSAWCVKSPPHLPIALLQPPWGEGAMGGHREAGPPSPAPGSLSSSLQLWGACRQTGASCQDIRLGVCSFPFSFSRSEPREATSGDKHCHLAEASVLLGLSHQEKTQLKPLGLANFEFFLLPACQSVISHCLRLSPACHVTKYRKQYQKCIFSQSWRPEVQDQGVIRVSFW